MEVGGRAHLVFEEGKQRACSRDRDSFNSPLSFSNRPFSTFLLSRLCGGEKKLRRKKRKKRHLFVSLEEEEKKKRGDGAKKL